MNICGLGRAIDFLFGIHVEYIWAYGGVLHCIHMPVHSSVVAIFVKWYTQKRSNVKSIRYKLMLGMPIWIHLV